MAKRTPFPRRDPHYWMQVTGRMFCALGGHDVLAGVWMRVRRSDHRGLASCETCLFGHYGVTRPTRPFTSSAADDAVDVRAKRAGED